VRLLILTGCRRKEIGGMRWSEFDDGKWMLPSERTKNGHAHTLPLSASAWSIINSVPRVADRDHLFGVRSDGFKDWGRKRFLDARLGDTIKAWTLRDLRRTVATRMADIGVQPHIIEAVLNHVSGHKHGVAGIYNRATYEPEKQQALALWADHLLAIAEGRKRVVVPLKTA
jgi:integrase